MLIRLGAAVSVKIQNVQLRGSVYQFALRIPQHLVSLYSKKHIRFSLATSDPAIAAKKAEEETRKLRAEFELLSSGEDVTPETIETAANKLADAYRGNFEHFLALVIDPAREKFAGNDETIYKEAHPTDYLKPHELVAWKKLTAISVFSLSNALQLYLKTHLRGNEKSFVEKTTRDWKKLILLIGDIEFAHLNRAHAREVVSNLTSQGNKTGTIRRTLNVLAAITNATIIELELTKANPFSSISIVGERKDTSAPTIASSATRKSIAASMNAEPDSAIALIIILQMELGTRIGEISGLPA